MTATACGTRSPTSQRSSIAAGRSRRRPGGAARPCTAPTCGCRSTPRCISEGAASLLPEADRPAVVFTIDLDATGERTAAHVERALVRSRAQARPTPSIDRRAGRAAARDRRAAHGSGDRPRRRRSCRCPSRRSCPSAGSPAGYRVELAERLPSEDWNAQISLLAGHSPPPRSCSPPGLGCCARWRVSTTTGSRPFAAARRRCDVAWPQEMTYGDFMRSLDPAEPRSAALLSEARGVMGHAGYTAFDGEPPAQPVARGAGRVLRAHDRADAAAGRPLRARPAGGAARRAAVGRPRSRRCTRLPAAMADAGARDRAARADDRGRRRGADAAAPRRRRSSRRR